MIPRAVFAAAAATLICAACSDDAAHDRAPVCAALPIGRWAPHSQCGPGADYTPINAYQGGDIADVQVREDAVVLINGSCTGTLIAAAAGPVVLTAGHCVGLGDDALLAFNVEADPDGDPLVTDGTVIERADVPDYALIALDALPAIEPTPLTARSSERVAIIQHPRGRPKEIAEGELGEACDPRAIADDVDTDVGSSGAGVLTQSGALLGVHTDGDCAADGSGANVGWSATAIVEASAYLAPGDLTDQ
jgi:hypothetical protein